MSCINFDSLELVKALLNMCIRKTVFLCDWQIY